MTSYPTPKLFSKLILSSFKNWVAFNLRECYLSRKSQVLTESKDHKRPGEVFGHTDNFLPVWISSENLEPNQLVDVELIQNTPLGLIGRLQ